MFNKKQIDSIMNNTIMMFIKMEQIVIERVLIIMI